MRKMEISEIDSQCFIIKTTDFRDDNVSFHWDAKTRLFYAQREHSHKRQTLSFADNPTIGHAIDFVLERERRDSMDQFSNLVATMMSDRRSISA